MPRDRDQQTPDLVDDREDLRRNRGQGTAGSGEDLLPGEAASRWGPIELMSAEFDDGDILPDRFAGDGGNVSPPLEWTTAPRGAMELALLCEDPDAPGGTFVHWVLTGIDPSVTGVEEGAVPAGATPGVNDFGETGWHGPQPPAGDGAHRYVFTLIASDAPLEAGPEASADDVRESLDGHELARGELVALYQRSPAG